jgi:hypothetical protein
MRSGHLAIAEKSVWQNGDSVEYDTSLQFFSTEVWAIMARCPVCGDELDAATGKCSRAHEPVAPVDVPVAADGAARKRYVRLTSWTLFVAVVGSFVLAFAVIFPAIYNARDRARRTASKNTLKQLALALHNYNEAFGVLPPGGVFDTRDTPYFGWHVSIMPFTASGPEFNMINFNVPWNDPNNAEIFRRPYHWYLNPAVSQTKDSRGFVLTHYVGNKNLLFKNSSLSIDDISDGLGQTVLAGEIAEGFLPYAQPGNWRDLTLGLITGSQSFGRPQGDGALVLMADGSVRFLANNTDPRILQALSTPAGGEDVGEQ